MSEDLKMAYTKEFSFKRIKLSKWKWYKGSSSWNSSKGNLKGLTKHSKFSVTNRTRLQIPMPQIFHQPHTFGIRIIDLKRRSH